MLVKSRIHSELLALYEASQTDPELDPKGPPSDSPVDSIVITQSAPDETLPAPGNFVAVDITVDDPKGGMLEALQAMGLVYGSQFGRVISGYLPVDEIGALVEMDQVLSAVPAMSVTNVGSVTSQGDAAQLSDVARDSFGVDGTGIKIGFLSDSYNNQDGEAAGIESGDLPAEGVEVLLEGFTEAAVSDEGRAMAELIHDVAPGADLAFHTAFGGVATFANGIVALAEAGAEIIVDDVLNFSEPYFQDGIVAQAVDFVTSQGVTYFSSVGNSDRGSYEAPFRSTGIPIEGLPFASDIHDFDPGEEVSTGVTFGLGPDFLVRFYLQWDQPYASASPNSPGSISDYDLILRDATTGEILAGSAADNIGADPFEFFGYVNETDDVQFVELVISKFSGPDAGVLKLGFPDFPTNFQDILGLGDEFFSSTIQGHNNAEGAISVGASFYAETPPFGTNPPLIESFSSAGQTPILFDVDGNRLETPIIRQGPDVVGPDGTDTTFFGFDVEGNGFPNFFGTSAAAPHVAAVAALMLEANPFLTPQEIEQILEETAIDMDDPFTPGFDVGFDDKTGFGFIQADAAVAAAAELLETGPFTLQILHASDLEGGVDAIGRAPNFAALVDAFEDDFANTLLLSAGDNFLPGPFFAAAGERSVFRDGGVFNDTYNDLFGLPADANGDGLDDAYESLREGGGRVDISIMNILGFDASAIGNHEFDLGSDAFESIIEEDFRGPGLEDDRWVGAQFPYLSANLDFSGDADLANLVTDRILPTTAFETGPEESLDDLSNTPKIAPATVFESSGQRVGVVGATTQVLEQITSPTGTTVIGDPGGNDMVQLASVLQPVIDELTTSGVNKIVIVSHLQQIALEQELATLLDGVDVIIAGGSDTILADETDVLRPGDTSGGGYPFLTQDASGNPVAIVSTAGEYSYLGRLVVEFDENGVIDTDSIDAAISGAFATTDEVVASVADGEDLFAEGTKAAQVRELTDAVTGIVIEKDSNVFGLTDVYLNGERADVRTQETNLGNLTADANLEQAQSIDPSVLVSIKNGGGIRAPIGEVAPDGTLLPPQANPLSGKEEGEVSQLDIENALRFNNGLSLITLTLEQLLEVLEHSVSATAPGVTPGQFAQVGGLAFSFDPDAPAGERVETVTVQTPGGRMLIVEEGEAIPGIFEGGIRIVTLNFLADGGDGYPFPDFVAANPAFANRQELTDVTFPEEPGAATFAPFGTEQDALAEFLADNHAVTPFNEADMAPELDLRIQNLDERNDAVAQTLIASGAIRVEGNNASSVIYGSESADKIAGGGGADVIFGFGGDDEIRGGGNRDVLVGGAGNDDLRGRNGNDELVGGSGNDELRGNSGADRLDGGAGNDVLRGGSEADIFIYSGGNDIIEDFKGGEDRLDISEAGLTFADLSSNSVQTANSVFFTNPVTGETLTILGATIQDLALGAITADPSDPAVAAAANNSTAQSLVRSDFAPFNQDLLGPLEDTLPVEPFPAPVLEDLPFSFEPETVPFGGDLF